MNRWQCLIASFMFLIGANLYADVALQVTANISSNWSTGYVAEINLTNASTTPVSSWTVNFGLQDGQTIACMWNGAYAQTMQNITVVNDENNGTILPGQSITLGFQADNPDIQNAVLSNLQASGVTSGSTSTLNASYDVTTVWATAYQVSVTLTNNTLGSTTSWTATFSLPQNNVLSDHVTNGLFTVDGQNVTVKNLSSNGVIATGGSVTFTMIINMPSGGQKVINNLQAAANGGTPVPPLAAPVLQTIFNPNNMPNYTVSWDSVQNAQSYALQESQTSSFSSPQTVYMGEATSFDVNGKLSGVYYYRVIAVAGSNTSASSNTQSVTVGNPTPPAPVTDIEYSAWYIDWTSWFPGPTYNIPAGVNMINVFVGELTFDASGNPTMDGFGNLNPPELDAFVAYCKAQQPPIAVKVSIGGGGGSYDRCWDRLTLSNVQAFAQGMVDYCHAHGLSGVDFDYEAFASATQETLVGTLIKGFKTLDPNLQTSLCTNAGFGPNYPWTASVKNILDAAMIGANNCAVDRLYVMSYYDPITAEQAWVKGWADWVIQNYGFTPARVSVGIDDFDAHAYDPVEFANWAASQGYSTAHWAYDPARP